MESINRSEPGTVAHWIEKYCLTTAIAQQHRNKVRWQADHIERVIKAGANAGKPARILLLACGSSPDVRMCLPRIVDHDFQIVLNDMDDGALEFSREKLRSLGERVKTVPGNMFRLVNKFAADGPFDLVLAGGLFDYLKDDQAAFLINAIKSKLLSPTGIFAFTNIAKPNPYKYWMEYCANWFLIERTEDDFESLIDQCAIDLKKVSFDMEFCGMTFLVEIKS
jgi:SAM-dependent methyltransferase